MNVEIQGSYLGNKKVKLTHGPSSAEIVTDSPRDIQGEGKYFSPTDLVAAALGSCMLTLIAIVAEKDKVDVSGMSMNIEKHMHIAPRRISALPVIIHLPKKLSREQRQKLEKAAMTCPVHHSLHPEISVPVEFIYDVE